LAVKKVISKIFAKIRFLYRGFFTPDMLKKRVCLDTITESEDADFVCKYFSKERSKAANIKEIKTVIGLAENKKNDVVLKRKY
jgi:hypothetical protein